MVEDPTGKFCHNDNKRTCNAKCTAHRIINGIGTFCVELEFMTTLSGYFEIDTEA